MEPEVAERRIAELHAELDALESYLHKVTALERRLDSAEAEVEASVRSITSRFHRYHDKRLQTRSLRDSSNESEVLQRVASSLGLELDQRGKKVLDAHVETVDAALQEERWKGLRVAVEYIYLVWGLFCLQACLFLATAFPLLSDRFGFQPPPAEPGDETGQATSLASLHARDAIPLARNAATSDRTRQRNVAVQI